MPFLLNYPNTFNRPNLETCFCFLTFMEAGPGKLSTNSFVLPEARVHLSDFGKYADLLARPE